jgi:cephalosporin-C deacetylase-like acetyl esterase
MPMIDMPLEELRQYKGINPCPDDMNAFWDEAVERDESSTDKKLVEMSTKALQKILK